MLAVAGLAVASIAGCPSESALDSVIDPLGGQPAPVIPPVVAPPVVAPKPAAPMLLVAGILSKSVQGFANPGILNGNQAPFENLSGAQTQLVNPFELLVTDADTLIVSDQTGKIFFYDDAEALNGNIEPSRNISGLATGFATPSALAWDPASDMLFVSNFSLTAQIKMFADVSDPQTQGNLAPSQQITSADLNIPFGLALSPAQTLYVANLGAPTIAVFENATQINGTVSASRVIRSPAAGVSVPLDLHLSADDTLYVIYSDKRVFVYRNAATLNGAGVMPDSILTPTGAVSVNGIAVDAAGTGYLVDNSGKAVLVYDDLATRNGAFAPDRTISGDLTQLTTPLRAFIWE